MAKEKDNNIVPEAKLILPRGKKVILQAEDTDYKRGLIVELLDNGGYEMAYWYDKPDKPYPVEILVDGVSIKPDGKVVEMKFHPQDYYDEQDELNEGDTYEKMAAKGKKAGNLKQGTVRKRLNIPKGEKIPLSKITKEISRIKKMDNPSEKNKKYLKALNLAKTLKTTTNVNEDKDPGATLGPGPKAGPDGVNDNYYVKAFKYKLVPKKNGTYVQKGSGLEVKKLF